MTCHSAFKYSKLNLNTALFNSKVRKECKEKFYTKIVFKLQYISTTATIMVDCWFAFHLFKQNTRKFSIYSFSRTPTKAAIISWA